MEFDIVPRHVYPIPVALPPLFPDRFWTVSTLTQQLRAVLEGTPALQDCWVRGEISNVSRSASGHIYFTLKDAGAALAAVVWRRESMRIAFGWQEGVEVEAHGRISVYPAAGKYQLVVDALQPMGEGLLYQEFLRLKARLEAEGLFDPVRKRPLPEYPARIGLVTSPTGAAVQDMLNTIRRRFPLAEVVLSPTLVQGVEAPPRIVAALQRVAREGADVVILARGGGSLEDLWAFNEEQVVRAVAACPVPVVTGVGHETDITLVDFASDLRAPTPTAAAELVTPDRLELMTVVAGLRRNLLEGMLRRSAARLSAQAALANRLRLAAPRFRLEVRRQALDDLLSRLGRAQRQQSEMRRIGLAALGARLAGVGPEAVVRRGYAIVTRQDDQGVVSSVRQVGKGDRINVRVRDGVFGAVAGDIQGDNDGRQG